MGWLLLWLLYFFVGYSEAQNCCLLWQQGTVTHTQKIFKARCSIAILLGCTKQVRKEVCACSMIAFVFFIQLTLLGLNKRRCDVSSSTKRKMEQSLWRGETKKGMWCNKCCLHFHACFNFLWKENILCKLLWWDIRQASLSWNCIIGSCQL